MMMIAPSFCYERVRSRRIFSLLFSVALLGMKLRVFSPKLSLQEWIERRASEMRKAPSLL